MSSSTPPRTSRSGEPLTSSSIAPIDQRTQGHPAGWVDDDVDPAVPGLCGVEQADDRAAAACAA